MIMAGVLTRVIPAGAYQYIEEDGLETIIPGTYQATDQPDYPIWRWFLAPIEVLGSSDGLNVIVIVVFILLVGGAFAILEKCGVLHVMIERIIHIFKGRKYALLLTISFFFMAMGAFFGIFEEVVPLIPLIVALSISLGWDVLVGLGMSILATNMGFSAALSNPFTIGVAQQLAGIPLFSGFWFRVPIFLVVFALLSVFLYLYAKRIEKKNLASQNTDQQRYLQKISAMNKPAHVKRASLVFLIFLSLIIAVLIGTQFVSILSSYSLPIVGILFFLGGLLAGLTSGAGGKAVARALREGISGILPGVPLILMAASVKFIVANGGIMDTILYQASSLFANASPFSAALAIFLIALLIEFFISSGSAKAFLLIPILVPLASILGVSRQVAVLSYCFGDGFSNMAYPTNAVLLISLGLVNIGYGTWIKWTWKIWLALIPVILFFLWLAITVQLGPA